MEFVNKKRSVIHSAAVVVSLSLSLGPSQKCISSEAWSSQVVCWAGIWNALNKMISGGGWDNG